MQEVSATYTSLLQSQHSVESKLEVWDKDGTNLIHTFNEQEISSMSTTRGLFANNTPSVGGTVSCEIDCELYVGDVEIPRMAMLKPYVRLVGENTIGNKQPSWLYTITPVYRFDTQEETIILTFYGSLKAVGTSIVPQDGVEYTIGYDALSDVDASFFVGKYLDVDGDFVKIENPFSIGYDESLEKYFVSLGSSHIQAVTTQSSKWLPKGVYWIDTRPTDHSSDKMTIHGYDAMLKGEVIFATETTVEDWPRTDLQVLNGYYNGTTLVHNGIAQKLGVEIQQETLNIINKGYEIQFPGTIQTEEESGQQVYKNVKGAAYTVREVLSFLGAAYCGNWTIDEDGTLRLVKLKPQEILLVDENNNVITFADTGILVG